MTIKTLKQLKAYCKRFHVIVSYRKSSTWPEVTLDCESSYCFEPDLHGLVSAAEYEDEPFANCLSAAIKDALNWCPQVYKCDLDCCRDEECD